MESATQLLDAAGPLADRAVAVIDPDRARARQRARAVLGLAGHGGYEATRSTRTRRLLQGSDRAPFEIVQANARTLRSQARHLERNHDLTSGALDTLVNRVVGTGIRVDFQPRRYDGTIHAELQQQLMALWRDWKRAPEVTRDLSWGQLQRLVARSWFRDGEAFSQQLTGDVPLLRHGTSVPFSIEAFEADFVPLDYEQAALNIRDGIERNAWVYKHHPNSREAQLGSAGLKAVPADRMVHLAMIQRLGQRRGVSVFASVMQRMADLQDYEQSELLAARIAASFAAYIKKGDASVYGAGDEGPSLGGAVGDAAGGSEPRELSMEGGMIFDDLAPGEDVGTIDSKRPNPELANFRNGQLRAFGKGIGAHFSGVSGDYTAGSYSAQRQEMIEAQPHYLALTDQFISRWVRPNVEQFIGAAMLSGVLAMPRDLDPRSLLDVDYRGPVLPWIDPLKEVNAHRIAVRAGFASRSSVVRDRGQSPDQVDAEIRRERERAASHSLTFDSDASQALAQSGVVDDS